MFDILIVRFLFERMWFARGFCFSWSWMVGGLLKSVAPVKMLAKRTR
jgi:hypothetical protein